MPDKELGFIHRYEPGSSGSRLTLLLLHGTGADENDLLPLGRALAPEANLLSPRGKVLENGAPRFFRRFAEGVLDVEDLKARAHELAAFVERAAGAYELDPERVVAAGYSNGANIAGGLLLLHPKLLCAAALFRPMVPFEPDEMPDLSGFPVFIAAGRTDPIVPPEDAEKLAVMLEGAGAEVVARWQEGGHGLEPAEMDDAAKWLRTISPSG
ncbi:MAG: alpha/beta hydrolase [Actinobacteria bacterium]|nr:alpha/beta hydrolase [Actinomycetota bacterium]